MYNTDPATTAAASNGGSPIAFIIWLVVMVIVITAMWKVFVKAGRPGWVAIIPFYNTYVLLKMVGRPGWWLILMFIPLVNIVILLLVSIDMAKAFGRSTTFGVVGLWLFSLIGYLILGFGSDKYIGPGGTSETTAPAPTPAA